jgi:protein-tyrosine phosphatase
LSPFRKPFAHEFEQIANFRDLGGHTTRDGRRVRHGRLFRSGHLGHSTDGDLEGLAALGLRRVFDFRTAQDIEADGADRLPRGAQHVQLPMPDPAKGEDIRSMIQSHAGDELQRIFGDGGAEQLMLRAAESIVVDRRAPYAEFLTELASQDTLPALFHCSAGKDRAGWAGTIVLLALGVDEDQVIEQYLLSNRELERIRDRLASGVRPEWSELLSPLLEVRRVYIEAAFSAMTAEWGSFDGYLHDGLGIDETQRHQLCDHLLEDM